MTVFEQLALWIGNIIETDLSVHNYIIANELLPAEYRMESAALMNNPNDTEVPDFMGNPIFTSYKTLCISRQFNSMQERIDNEAFFDALCRIIRKKNQAYELPDNDGREWRSIGVIGTYYPISRAENESTAIYQMTLKLIYKENL
jgi:hypothetical protein